MENRYDHQEALAFGDSHPGCPADLAMRVYTSRLIGREPELVLHGGGNTSVKSTIANLLGEPMEILFIKGSGWDLATIEPAGFPGLDLAYLRKLRRLKSLTDEEMVNQFRTHLLDAASPNPSIETLVHAFLPHKFIDHTHADAIVTLTNQPESDRLLREALGEKIGVLPFILPGFPLAKAMAELCEQQPDMEYLVLKNHGIFTFGATGQEAYDRMIEAVSRAESYIDGAMGKQPSSAARPVESVESTVVLPILRGALALPAGAAHGRRQTLCLHLCNSAEVVGALARPDAEALFSSGVLTPDHVIRTKNYPLFLDCGGVMDEAALRALIEEKIALYCQRYDRYFAEQVATKQVARTKLDPMPRVVLIPGLGMVTAGLTPEAARMAADIARHTLAAKVRAMAVGSYRELDPAFIFDMEYWSLEQAKLGKGSLPLLAGKVALVTGGGGAIAVGIGRRLLAAGARLFLTDINEQRLNLVRNRLAAQFGLERVTSLVMDVTDSGAVAAGMARFVEQAGGLDILVPNAGIAHVATIAELDEAKFRQVLDVNLLGVFQVIKAAVPIFRRQGTGGHIVINSSKNVFDPGAAFGAYSASKAGAHQLGKIAALELAGLGVRVNMINPDAIFDADEVSSGLWDEIGPERMRSRNLDPQGLKEYYRQRNLLHTEVLADHVGNAVVFFASEQTPTTGATLPVDGGIPAAFPR
ncbi:MAG: bifunctional aldolase/short-chain dehydrogenase [Desulfobulbaceae bacterium]|nr:bifunctional aldolase/short-chain dehydrogenase [Desulfobulbaceae bacterium]